MSHELRTPLNAILGFGQLLEMDAGCGTPDQQQSIKYILSAGHQLLGLVSQLLDLSRIDIGKLALNMQPLCIADLTSSCVDQVAAAMANQRNITIENTITDTGLVVQGDDLRIRQVLINLLSNAVKYNQENGRVTVSSVLEKAGRLRIEVRDTGHGIASDKLSLLFTPFERIDQKHGTISGVGIGLHISKQLVEAMHGTMGVESVPGKGSIFWFELPLAEIEDADESTVSPEKVRQPIPSADARFVVLYIEDNPVNVQLVERALQSRPGIELLAAGTAEEGLTIAEEALPDLILMDIHLPGIDGIAATILLKGIDATRNIPVVALSADAMKEDIDRALSAGCSAYLTKPIDLETLFELIDSMRPAGSSV
jgi:CheY-like chemotaxis protein